MLLVYDHAFTTILSFYERTEETFKEDVTIIKKWVKSQSHLPEIMDDARIKNFLLMNKCCVERTKEKIENYYKTRGLIKEFCFNLDSSEIKKSMEIGYWNLLPRLTKNMCRVHFIKIRKPELINELDPVPYCARGIYALEVQLKEDCMYKQIAVVDLAGVNWGYVLKVTPTMVWKIITIFEKVYSNRLEAIYAINSFPAIQKFLSTVKAFLKPKLFERIHVCLGTEILHEVFPKEMIPEDYRGEEKSMEQLHTMWNEKLNGYKNWFDELSRMRINEALRPTVLKNDEILGFYGNFKQLSLD